MGQNFFGFVSLALSVILVAFPIVSVFTLQADAPDGAAEPAKVVEAATEAPASEPAAAPAVE